MSTNVHSTLYYKGKVLLDDVFSLTTSANRKLIRKLPATRFDSENMTAELDLQTFVNVLKEEEVVEDTNPMKIVIEGTRVTITANDHEDEFEVEYGFKKLVEALETIFGNRVSDEGELIKLVEYTIVLEFH